MRENETDMNTTADSELHEEKKRLEGWLDSYDSEPIHIGSSNFRDLQN